MIPRLRRPGRWVAGRWGDARRAHLCSTSPPQAEYLGERRIRKATRRKAARQRLMLANRLPDAAAAAAPEEVAFLDLIREADGGGAQGAGRLSGIACNGRPLGAPPARTHARPRVLPQLTAARRRQLGTARLQSSWPGWSWATAAAAHGTTLNAPMRATMSTTCTTISLRMVRAGEARARVRWRIRRHQRGPCAAAPLLTRCSRWGMSSLGFLAAQPIRTTRIASAATRAMTLTSTGGSEPPLPNSLCSARLRVWVRAGGTTHRPKSAVPQSTGHGDLAAAPARMGGGAATRKEPRIGGGADYFD